MRTTAVMLAALTVLALGCSQCQGVDALGRTYRLATPLQDTVEFGDVFLTADKARQVGLRSDGNGPVLVQSVTLEGSAAFSLQGDTRDILVQPGVEQAWDVVFAPVETGDAEAVAVLHNNSENRPEIRVQLRAHGSDFPSCNDNNPCTRDFYDPLLGACQHFETPDSCNDGNACTEADTCVRGRCLGLAVTCVDPDPCTRDLCDATSGCVFITDVAACDDNQPCTAEICNPMTGCGHVPLADGVPCGVGPNTCMAALVCQGGQCVGTALPDGAPCTDFLSCTVNDRCQDGICAGNLTGGAQVSSTAYSFAANSRVFAVASGNWLYTVESSWSQSPLEGDGALTAIDVSQRPVQVAHALPLGPELIPTRMVAAGTHVVLKASRRVGGQVEAVWVGVEREPDGSLVRQQTLIVPGVSTYTSDMAVVGNDLWTCAGETLYRVDLPQLSAPLDTGVPCHVVAAGAAADGGLWVGFNDTTTQSAVLRRYNVAGALPVLEASFAWGLLYSLQVLDGVGLAVGDQRLRLLALDDLRALGDYETSSRVASLGMGRALLGSNGAVFSIQTPGGVFEQVQVDQPALALGATAALACAQQVCLVVSPRAPYLVASPAHGVPLAMVPTLGMGGFNRVLDVDGQVFAASPLGVHTLAAGAGGLTVEASKMFGNNASAISWRLDGEAPLLGDMASTPAFAPLGARWNGGLWMDGRLETPPDVLGTMISNVGAVAVHGPYVFGVRWQGDRTERQLVIQSMDTTRFVAGVAGLLPVESTVTLPFVEPGNLGRSDLIRVAPSGDHVLAVAPFDSPTRGAHLFSFRAQQTQLTHDWSALVQLPYQVVDVAYDEPNVLVLMRQDTLGNTVLERYRYGGQPGTMDLVNSVASSPGAPMTSLLLYDGDFALVAVPQGMRSFWMGGDLAVDTGTIATVGRPVDVRVLQDRLWVTTRYAVQTFSPPCPPDIMPP